MASIIRDKLKSAERYQGRVQIFLGIFFLVGFWGITIPQTHLLFLKLFPTALILSFALMLLFHRETFGPRTLSSIILIAVAGYFIEVAGVNTGLIFGDYTYGKTLGYQIFNTPLLIGLNWVMLSYALYSVTENMPVRLMLKILIASALMVFYDFVLEQTAPLVDMWHWENGTVPLQNYIAWFVVSALFQLLLKISGVRTGNSLAWKIILYQAVLFISLILFYKSHP